MRRPPLTRLVAAAALTVALTATPAAARPADPVAASPVVGGRLLASTGLVVSPEATAVPAVAAQAWVVADATTGRVLAAKAPHLRLRPASTLKTLTALTLLPRLDPAALHTATDADVRVEGSKAGLVPGGTYTVDELFTGLFLPSGNDAATALANAAGGVPATVAAMNDQAQRLHARDTTAVNPTGLDADGQLTSAYDLALIARAGLQRADFRGYAAMTRAEFPGRMPTRPGAARATFQIQNQNRLLTHGYHGAVGVKTGYTTLAGRTFVGAAERDGHLLVVTLLRIGQPTEDAARALLDWGFANRDRPGIGELVDPLPGDEASATPTPSPAAVTAPARADAAPAVAVAGAGSGLGDVGLVGVLLFLGGLGVFVVLLHSRRQRTLR